MMTGPGDIVLAIEASNPSVGSGVAVGRRGEAGAVEVLGVEVVRSESREEDDLMPAVDRVCRGAGVGAREIRLVAVSVGPGGYTAVRVATAAGKMIAEGVGARCVAVPTAMVAALGAGAEWNPDRGVAVMLASKGPGGTGGEASAWVAVLKGTMEGWIDASVNGRIVNAAGAGALGGEAGLVIADRFLSEPLRAAIAGVGLRVVEPRLDAEVCLRVACAGVLPEIDPVALVPLYPREPDAVTLWRAKKGKG
ncbi:MAG: hypothetical protein KF745_07215 [Phycisphaeraceae bacterium]|nr:hypothetical protein [Phycisphaeraceae bacterium]